MAHKLVITITGRDSDAIAEAMHVLDDACEESDYDPQGIADYLGHSANVNGYSVSADYEEIEA